MPSAEHGW